MCSSLAGDVRFLEGEEVAREGNHVRSTLYFKLGTNLESYFLRHKMEHLGKTTQRTRLHLPRLGWPAADHTQHIALLFLKLEMKIQFVSTIDKNNSHEPLVCNLYTLYMNPKRIVSFYPGWTPEIKTPLKNAFHKVCRV